MSSALWNKPRSRKAIRALRNAYERRNKNALLLCVLPVFIIAKLMVAFVLPPKYFYDNNRILSMTNTTLGLPTSDVQEWEGSYRVASNLFAQLDFARLDTMLDWSICLGIIFTMLLAVMVMQADSPDLLQSLFILATVGLLNIYIFTIGKDIIQFAFFLAVYVVLMLPLDNPVIKLLLSAAILYYESTFFRQYYILIAALIIVVYAVLTFCRQRNEKLSLISLVEIVAILFCVIYVMMIAASVIMPGEYNQMIGLRAGYSTSFGDSSDSVTQIKNWIPGGGLPIFMVNYIINGFRMMFPVELALRGAYYLPFFAFQLMVTFYMFNLMRQISSINEPVLFLALCIFVGYALASFIFEPDFGSWTRHESATFPVLHLLVLNHYQKIPLTQQERALQMEGF